MKSYLFVYFLGILTAVGLYVFRAVISAWVQKKEAAAKAKLEDLTTPKA